MRNTEYKFSSVYQFGRALEKNLAQYPNVSAEHHNDCAASMVETLKTASHGGASHDPKQVQRLLSETKRLNTQIRANGVALKVTPAVAGAMPSIPRALAGAPKSMLRMHKQRATAPVVRIGFHVGRIYSVKESTVFYRAAALLAICDQLERQGQRVELVAVWRNRDDSGDSVKIDVTVKEPYHLYTPAAMAFTLDPAFQRRLCWGWHDTEHAADHGPQLTGYGNGMSERGGDFDYFAPYLTRDTLSAKEAYDKIVKKWGLA